jgi:hypothetical protein
MQKSWNQKYRESGTTLTYKEWRRREDEKMASFDGIPSVSLQSDANYQKTHSDILAQGGYKTDISNNTIFGINKYVVIIGGALILSAAAYVAYKKFKK